VYSLAATFLYLITGRPARLDADSVDSVLGAFPTELAPMIKHMLREDPKERMASAAFVAAALERFRRPPAQTPTAGTASPVPKRQVLLAVCIVVGLVLLALGGLWLMDVLADVK
jgi:hypothetical protein